MNTEQLARKLIQIESQARTTSQFGKQHAHTEARKAIKDAGLPEDETKALLQKMYEAANPTTYSYENTGIKTALFELGFTTSPG